ncbi:EAL domain-containing protein [Alteromonas sp. 1_MG-2023]|uniref:putative bifunctional diguanylate cyclase/phosphodiesterase n=1 Tax=Alteromonas sp. 1_MG-2023 TaxID=3062669 RepID=UPI0026E27C15|nr:bifunctional diguanylate cyclase/phosphodiesterase [Alteromonas sp. 1_MG-2023]MDO6567820.1 EAL domain-containing protein [Alteromonas sp. 1_MG-2023]
MGNHLAPTEQQLQILTRRLEREKSARKSAEQLLIQKSQALYDSLQLSRQAQKKLELALWASQESFWDWQASTDTIDIRAFSLDSESETTWSGTPFDLMALVHEDDLENLQFHWSMALHGGRERMEVSFRMVIHGQSQWIRLRGRVLTRGKSGEGLHVVGTTRDITQQRSAEQSFQLMASAFANSREAMLVLSPTLVINECNNAFVHLIGAPDKDACIDVNINKLIKGEKVSVQALNVEKQLRFESVIATHEGKDIPIDVSVSIFENHEESSSSLIATMRDISERKRSEERLKHLALYDGLTGLSNRNAIREIFQTLHESDSEFIVVFIDLDGFKAINDSAGHERGDEELRRVAALLTATFGPLGEVARWGGDEFIALLTDYEVDTAVAKSEALIGLIEEDLIVTNRTELRLSASIGIAQFPIDNTSIDRVVQSADAAMYHAKTLGKGQVYVYEEGLYESMTQQVSMVNDLRKAIQNNLLDFYVQGKYDLQGNLKGGEVLCRWNSGLHGAVSPSVFIPMAEENRLDSHIGLQALEAACDYIVMMETQKGESISLSINVSVTQLLDVNFPAQAMKVCKECSVPTDMIELELTESIFIKDESAAFDALNALSDAGFRLSLDDFGSGFSSLSYLKSFHFEVVKLDRSLVVDIIHNSKALALFSGIVAMLSRLQIEIVVEGIEQESYIPFMREADVTLMQGFYFDKPMPYDQFIAKHINVRGIRK